MGTRRSSPLLFWAVFCPLLGKMNSFAWADRSLTTLLPQGFLIGALLPLFPYFMHKAYGGTFWKKVSVPLILHGVSALF